MFVITQIRYLWQQIFADFIGRVKPQIRFENTARRIPEFQLWQSI